MIKAKKNITIVAISIGIVSIAIFVWRYLFCKLGIENYINIDDLCSIQFAMTGENSIAQKLKGIMIQDPTNVPLFYLLLYVMISIGGFDVNTMRYLPEFLAALAIMVMAFIGYKSKGKKGFILMTALSITSVQIIYTAFQLRAYSLLVLNAALLMLTWQYREKNRVCQAFYLFALWLLSFSHFFGVLLCFAFGLWDLIHVIAKKKPIRTLIVYVAYCVVYIPYLAISFYFANEMYGSFWPPVPDYYDAIQMIYRLSPGHLVGFAIFIYAIISRIANRNDEKRKVPEIYDLAIFAVFIVVGIGFVYSRYINPNSSVWVYRYFLVLFPCVLYIIVDCLTNILSVMGNILKITEKEKYAVVVSIALVALYINFDYSISNQSEINTGGSDFGSLKEFINGNEDIKKDGTLVFFPYPQQYFDGWMQFMTEGNTYDAPNIVCTYEELNSYDLSQIDEIYAIGWIYNVFDGGMTNITEFAIVEENCGGLSNVYRFEKLLEGNN